MIGLALLSYHCGEGMGAGWSGTDGGIPIDDGGAGRAGSDAGGSGGMSGSGGGGGACTYASTPGTIRITDVTDGQAGDYNCVDGMRVRFDFTPNDPSRVSAGDHGARLTIPGGASPPRSCLAMAGIAVNATFTARRRDIELGPCSPVEWDVDIPNWDLCRAQCYGG